MSKEVLEEMNISYVHIIESTSRNTATAIAFAGFASGREYLLLVTPSDHIIEGM